MQEKYEKQLAELQQITKAEFEQLVRDHKAEVSGLKSKHAEELDRETKKLIQEKETIVADTVAKHKA